MFSDRSWNRILMKIRLLEVVSSSVRRMLASTDQLMASVVSKCCSAPTRLVRHCAECEEAITEALQSCASSMQAGRNMPLPIARQMIRFACKAGQQGVYASGMVSAMASWCLPFMRPKRIPQAEQDRVSQAGSSMMQVPGADLLQRGGLHCAACLSQAGGSGHTACGSTPQTAPGKSD